MKAFTYRRVKNDEKDAADLADLLRMGRLPEAWIAPAEIRELRELTRYRLKLVQRRSSCKQQVHAVLAKLGIQVTCSDLFGAWGNTWLDGLSLPQPYAGKVASLRKLIGELATEIALLDAVIADLLAGHDGYRALQALPGTGPVLGAVITAEIGDIRRFASPAKLCCWAGLTPRHRESDLKVTRGHITKQGSRALRWAVVEAIQRQPATSPIRDVQDRIIARRGKQARNIVTGSQLVAPEYDGLPAFKRRGFITTGPASPVTGPAGRLISRHAVARRRCYGGAAGLAVPPHGPLSAPERAHGEPPWPG